MSRRRTRTRWQSVPNLTSPPSPRPRWPPPLRRRRARTRRQRPSCARHGPGCARRRCKAASDRVPRPVRVCARARRPDTAREVCGRSRRAMLARAHARIHTRAHTRTPSCARAHIRARALARGDAQWPPTAGSHAWCYTPSPSRDGDARPKRAPRGGGGSLCKKRARDKPAAGGDPVAIRK